MFACICRAVTTDEVDTAIDDGAATLRAVARATRACTACGSCRPRIQAMIGARAMTAQVRDTARALQPA